MVYRLKLFCRAGEIGAEEALAWLVDEVFATDGAASGEWLGPYADGIAAYSAPTRGSGVTERAGRLTIELRVGVEQIADSVIHADPDGGSGVWGCDLLIELSLSGDDPGGELVDRIWAVAASHWSGVAWDDMSGFELQRDAPETDSLGPCSKPPRHP